MGESTKVLCVLLLIVGIIAAAIAWYSDRPDAVTWGFRVGGPIVALLALALFLKLHFRRDLVHDYLRDVAGNYFNRDGFCFAVNAIAVDGIAFMVVYFQNQYDQPSVGRVAMRPGRNFLMNRAKIATITYELECAPAAFGVARMAMPIPIDRQGKRQAFEVGASVHYPDGKGQRLRFHDGVFVRTNTNFGNAFKTALTVTAAVTGSIVLSKPVGTTIILPESVADDIPRDMPPEVKILWKLGDNT